MADRRTSRRSSQKPFTIPHFKAWSGQLELDDGGTFLAEPFQLRFLRDVFSGVPEAWLVVPEANGKTTLIAALALYHSRFREQAYVPVAASAQEQSLILFRQAAGFVRRTDAIRDEFLLRPGVREIRCSETGAVIKAKAADDRTGDGEIPTLAVLDELHRHKSLDLYQTWRGKIGKRKGAQVVVISTAGEPGSEFEETRKEIRGGEIREGAFVRVVSERMILHDYALPDGAEPEDMKAVKRANPFRAITRKTLRDKHDSPTMSDSHWRRFNCNLPTRITQPAVTEKEWREANHGMHFPAGVPCVAGLDVGWRYDSTALVPLIQEGDSRILGPATILVPPPDGQLQLGDVTSAIRDLHGRNPIRLLVMDVSDARDVYDWAENELGLDVEVRSVGLKSQIADYSYFMEALREGILKHSGDPGLTRHVLNATVRIMPLGDAVFARPGLSRNTNAGLRDRRQIDALVAAAYANTVVSANPSSVYDERGLITV